MSETCNNKILQEAKSKLRAHKQRWCKEMKRYYIWEGRGSVVVVDDDSEVSQSGYTPHIIAARSNCVASWEGQIQEDGLPEVQEWQREKAKALCDALNKGESAMRILNAQVEEFGVLPILPSQKSTTQNIPLPLQDYQVHLLEAVEAFRQVLDVERRAQ